MGMPAYHEDTNDGLGNAIKPNTFLANKEFWKGIKRDTMHYTKLKDNKLFNVLELMFCINCIYTPHSVGIG
jgi:hypothetical protein